MRSLSDHIQAAREIARQFNDHIEVKKVAIHSDEAARYGKVDSGHGISEAAQIQPDMAQMMPLIAELDRLMVDEVKNEGLIDANLKKLEEVLKPIKEKARELEYLMTPVLVINDQVKSMDYVPGKEEIRAWIEIELRRQKGL